MTGQISKDKVRFSWRTTRWWRVIVLSAWLIVGFAITQYVCVPLLVELGRSLGVDYANLNQNILLTVFAFLTYAIASVVIMGVPYIVAKKKIRLAQLGFDRLPQWRDISVAVGGIAVYFVLATIVVMILTLLPWFDATQPQDTGYTTLYYPVEYVLVFIALVILAPFVEEVLFRGYFYGTLRRWSSMWVAGVVTSVLFAFAHQQWNVGVDVFVLSLVLVATREYTGSIWSSILIHMAKNAVAYYLVFINPSIVMFGG